MQTRRQNILRAEGFGCRAGRMILDQLTQLAEAPNSEVIEALRRDLQQILDSYGNTGQYLSSRNHALSMAVCHSSQRATGFSSRTYPALQSSSRGPYSTNSQTNYADRSQSALLFQGGWLDQARNADLDAHLRWGPPAVAQLPTQWCDLSPGPPAAAAQSQTAAAAATAAAGAVGNHPNTQRLDPPGWLFARQGLTGGGVQPHNLTRATSNVSAAGTWQAENIRFASSDSSADALVLAVFCCLQTI